EQYLELRSTLAQARPSASEHSGSSGGNQGGRHPQRRSGSALGIARLRLASGEIGVDEFTALRTALDA
ncbi:MAG TPA: hypothetical protein VFN03_10135, partial [Trueperaceae bacterium]|nr:hypothetical protein [Trueperaceae bacterium]